MALQVRNAPGQAGYVLLVFDRDIVSDPFRLAIFNLISRTYLGRSIGKANWSPARSHFFDAELVSRGDGETVFKIGPEVTAFIPDETTLELTSEDNAVRETTVWHSVLLEFHWTAPDVNQVDEPGQRPAETDRRRQAETAGANAAAARASKEKPPLEAIAEPAPVEVPEAKELASWDVIKASENGQDFCDHLARFPNGITGPMARTRLEALAWLGLAPRPDLPALRGFLEAFPDGAHAGEARSKLEVLERQAATVREADERERRAAEAREAASAAENVAAREHFPTLPPESTQADAARIRTDENTGQPRLPKKTIFVAAAISAFAAIIAVAVVAILLAGAANLL